MTKYLLIGDVHIKTNNISTIGILLKEILGCIIKYKPQYTVIMGDLADSHSNMHIQAWNMILYFLKKISEVSNIIYIVGNHDMLNNQQFLNTNHWFNVFNMFQDDNITIVDKVYEQDSVLFVPYVYNGRFQEAIDTYGNIDHIKCIFCHQEFVGARMNSIVSVHGDILPNKPVFSGHIHDRQKYKTVHYTGSPIDTSFVKPVKRYLDLITIEDNIQVQEVELFNIPRKIAIYMSCDEFLNFKHEFNKNDQYKVVISDNNANIFKIKQTDKYKKLIQKKNINILFKPKDVKQTIKNVNKSSDFLKILDDDLKNEDEAVRMVYLKNKEAL